MLLVCKILLPIVLLGAAPEPREPELPLGLQVNVVEIDLTDDAVEPADADLFDEAVRVTEIEPVPIAVENTGLFQVEIPPVKVAP